tara:strand:- start:490 stop:1344 length:855 start_codon:yes stop_codon:yes gene_type:complete
MAALKDNNTMSLLNTDAFSIEAKAATVYAAQENSLFLPGGIVPIVNTPSGLVRVPELAAASADILDGAGGSAATDDITAQAVADTKNTITAKLFAARAVVRDLGGIDPAEVGTSLGKAVAAEFDKRAINIIANNTTEQEATDATLSTGNIFRAIGAIRAAGETGQLYCLVAASSYSDIMNSIGNANFAGSDLQNEAMRSGFMANFANCQMYVTQHLTDTNAGLSSHNIQAVVFGSDAFRIAMQKNVDIEVARRAAAVGVDVVASLHAEMGAIDSNRSVLIVNES